MDFLSYSGHSEKKYIIYSEDILKINHEGTNQCFRNCYGLNCMPLPQKIRSPNLPPYPVPVKVTLFGKRFFQMTNLRLGYSWGPQSSMITSLLKNEIWTQRQTMYRGKMTWRHRENAIYKPGNA